MPFDNPVRIGLIPYLDRIFLFFCQRYFQYFKAGFAITFNEVDF